MCNKITLEVDPLVLKDLHFSCERTLRIRKAYLEKITLAVNPREATDEEIKIEEEHIRVLSETLKVIEKTLEDLDNKKD